MDAARTRTRWLLLGVKIAVPLLAIGAIVQLRLRAAVPVRVFTVERGDVVQEVFGRGTLESRREAQLGFDLVGRISDLRVDEGDHVRLGQVLGSLAPEQFTADVKTASNSVSLARAAISRLEAEERRAAASLSFAEAEEVRARSLIKGNSISPRDLDLAEQQLALARAELDRVRATRTEAQQQIAVASGNVQVRNVTATRAVLIAPFDGVVTRRMHDPGDTVTIGATVLRLVATDALWSRAWIDESALPLLREKQSARVRLGAEGVPSLEGTVDRIGREVDRQTHELLVDVLLAAPPARLAIGQRADAWIEVARKRAVVRIPTSFVRRDAQGPFCFVSSDGRIRRAPLTLGLEGIDLVEVKAPLQPGQLVLAPGGAEIMLPEGRRWSVAGAP